MDIKDEADLVNVRLGIILKYVLKKMEKQSADSCTIDFEHIPVTIEIKKKKEEVIL